MHEYDERSSRFSKQERESEQIARRENRMSGHQVEAVYTGFSNLPLDVQSRRDDRILARILDDDEFEDEEFEDTQTVESAFVQSEIVASNYLDAGWGEITNTENISEEQIEAEREIANEVLAGALKGDFNSDPTFWSDISQIVTGLIPIAGQLGDIRDLVHILDDITNKEGYKKIGSWAILVLIAIGFIPGIGDGIKTIGKRGLGYLDNNRILKNMGEFLGENIIAPILNSVGDLTAPIVDQIKNAIRRKLTEAEIARQLGEGVDNVIDDVTGRPQVATEGAGNVPSRMETEPPVRGNEPMQMRGSSGSFSFPTPESVLENLSNRNKKHLRRHLAEFQDLDPTITAESLRELGASIVKPEYLNSSLDAEQLYFDKVIYFNGNPTRVRAVLNRERKLRSVQIRYK